MKHKDTNIKKDKNLNMRTLNYTVFFVFGFFLLSISAVKSTACIDTPCLINFTTSTPYNLAKLTTAVERIKSLYLAENDTWYVSYKKTSNDANDYYMSKWTNNFTVKTTDFMNTWYCTYSDPAKCPRADWVINTNTSFDINYDYGKQKNILWVGTSLLVDHTFRAGNTSLNDMTKTTELYDGESNNPRFVSISNNNQRFTRSYADGTGFNWYDLKTLMRGHADNNGSLTFPDYVTSFNSEEHTQLIYVNSIDEYWFFYVEQNKNLRVSRYNNDMSYINTHLIRTSDYFPSSSVMTLQFNALYSERYGYVVYLAIHEYYNNTIELLAFDTVGTKQINNLVTIDNQRFNLQDRDSMANSTAGNLTESINLASDGNRFYLFYAYNYTATDSIFNVLQESFTCSCTAWSNSTCVDNSHRRQIRDCVPSNCNSQVQNIVDPTCQYIPPTENATKQYENTSLCVRFGNSLGTTTKCEFNVNIPPQCQANTVKVTLESHIESQNNKQCDKGNYNLTLCNPSFSCNQYTHPCDEFNHTHSYTRLTYQPSETAFLQALGYVPTSCGSSWCLWNALDKWDFYAEVKTECQIACYNHKVCGSGESFGFSCDERSDCYKENCTFCTNGCYENTGSCYVSPSGIPPLTGNIDPFTYIIDLTQNAFSPVILTILSVCIIGGGMIITATQMNNVNWQVVLSIGILLSFVFWSIHWLDTIYMVLFILSLALLWSRSLVSHVKGGE